MQQANEKQLYRVVFDEIHKVITDITYREAFFLFPRLYLAGVLIFGSSASIPQHLVLALFQLIKTHWKVICTLSNHKELIYEVRTIPRDINLRKSICDYWLSVQATYGPLDRCLIFCRTIDEAKEMANVF
jgi:hypothetical protein